MPRHYILLDACVAAAYFAPKSTTSAKLRLRATALLSGSSPDLHVKFLMPNFCIAEVFAVFEKYRWGRTWNRQVKAAHTLTPKQFSTARKDFRDAIHNGAHILQVDLNRYHILAVDLVSPVNNAYKIKRDRGMKRDVNPAKTYDMLIVAMGIWLKHQFGDGEFTIVTGDDRLAAVVERAKSAKLGVPIRKHLSDVAKTLGLSYSPDLYPKVLNLTHVPKSELASRFTNWNPAW
jgi:hypothetical protein